MSRSRFAIWNYLSGMLFTAVTILGLAVTRSLVTWLGEDRYGAARSVADCLGFLTIFEVGFGATLGPLFARAIEDRREGALEAIVSCGLRVFLGLFAVSVLIALAMIPFVTRLIPVEPDDRPDLRLAWMIGLAGLAPMVLAPVRILADARQHGYRINLALAAQSLVIFGLSLLFASMGWRIAGQVAATTLAALPLALFLIRDGLRSHPGLLRAAIVARPDPSAWSSMVGLALPMLLMTLSGRFGMMTDNLVVGNILGPAMVTRLVTSQRLAVVAQSQLQGIGGACWAALAALHNQGRRNEFNLRLVELTRLVALLGIAALGPIMAYSRHFVGLWMGPDIFLGDKVVAVASVNALLLGLVTLWSWCFSGTGQIGRILGMTVAGSAINLAASILLTHSLGPIGTLLGTSVNLACVGLWSLPLLLRRTFGTPVLPLIGAAIGPIALGVPFVGGLYLVANAHTPPGWFGLGAEMAVAAVAYLGLAGVLLLGPADRAAWTRRIADAFRRTPS